MENRIVLVLAFGLGIAIPSCCAVEKYSESRVQIEAMKHGYEQRIVEGYIRWVKEPSRP